MTDRELLELAAQAAGIDYKHDNPFWFWNPLTDDGDALRLAVRLKIDIFFHPHRVECHVAGGRVPSVHAIEREDYGYDHYAATRRAIVRVAAEIGKERGNDEN